MKPYWQHLIRKYISIVFIISFFLLLINNLLVFASKPELSLAPVSNISLDDTPRAGEQEIIYITGNLCCPCYELHSHDVNIDVNIREVDIKLWQEKSSDACLQILISYNHSIEIIFSLSGIWTITCNGKNFSVTVYN